MFRTTEKMRNGQKQKIVAYGTSLTSHGNWSEMLAGELDRQFEGCVAFRNAAESGKWSTWGAAMLEDRVLVEEPDLVLMEFAANDCVLRYRTSPEMVYCNIENMILRTRDVRPECEFLLLSMNLPLDEHAAVRPKLLKYVQIYRQAAEDFDVSFLDLLPSWTALYEKDPQQYRRLVPDGIHPSIEGHRKQTVPAVLEFLLQP